MSTQNPMMSELCEILRENPKTPFAECRDRLAKRGHNLYPISYGRALTLLGVIKAKPRGTGERAKFGTRANAAQPARRPVGRPRKPVDVAALVETVKAGVERLQSERDQARADLERIRKAIG